MHCDNESYVDLVHRIDPVAKVAEWHRVFHVKPIYTPLRVDLTNEEVEEFCQANSNEEKLDALCDIMYVVAGTLVCKNQEYVPQRMITLENLDQVGDCYLLNLAAKDFAFDDTDNYNLHILLELCAMIAQHYKFDLARNFDIVHENNMKKLWTQEQIENLPADCMYSAEYSKEYDAYIVKSLAGKVIKPPGHQKPQLEVV